MVSSLQDSRSISREQSIYFNLLADIGHTKHIGGLKATARLMELIAPQSGDRVLDVGCGVGIAPVFMARQFGCYVTGVDITPGSRGMTSISSHSSIDPDTSAAATGGVFLHPGRWLTPLERISSIASETGW